MNKKWTPEHIQILRRTYPLGIKAAREALPGYSFEGIKSKAARLDLSMLKECKAKYSGPEVTDEQILEVLRSSGGMSKAKVADAVGLTVHAMQYRLNKFKDRELADTRGEGNKTIWIALAAETRTGVIPDEYIKVASIWSVARRCAALVGVQA